MFPSVLSKKAAAQAVAAETAAVTAEIAENMAGSEAEYRYPPVSLLHENGGENHMAAGAELRNNSRRLAETLASFGVDAKAGDVIRCDDGTDYTIKDVSRWDKNAFSSAPLGELPAATCDWSKLPQPEMPRAEARHFTSGGQDYLFQRNLYETRRMLYTLYNAIGDNPETWQNGQPVKFPSGNDKVKINLTIPADVTPQSFWPWRSEQITELFNSCPPGTYSLEAWDVYKNGVFQYTEYSIYVS